MHIEINGEARDTPALTLAKLWEIETEPLSPPSRHGFAIALNGAVVRALAWDDTPLTDGDKVEIIRAMAGG